MTPATSVVADTQILIWYVIDPDRLTADAIAALEDATAAEEPIYVSGHSLVELVYAVEKATNPLTPDDRQAILDGRGRRA
jgi:PIN domain nuclease of toxin-antitoxin system